MVPTRWACRLTTVTMSAAGRIALRRGLPRHGKGESRKATLEEPLCSEVLARRFLIRTAVLKWVELSSRMYPWRRAGASPYEVLVAEVLLRRTTAKAVARVYSDFVRRFPSISALASADENDLNRTLSTLGLQEQRSKGLVALAECLFERHGAIVPSSYSELVALPQVGPYIASAVLSLGYGTMAPLVDSNVERILRRLFSALSAVGPSAGSLTAVAWALLPRNRQRDFNIGLLDIGALVCKYRSPQCSQCPLSHACDHSAARVALGESV